MERGRLSTQGQGYLVAQRYRGAVRPSEANYVALLEQDQGELLDENERLERTVARLEARVGALERDLAELRGQYRQLRAELVAVARRERSVGQLRELLGARTGAAYREARYRETQLETVELAGGVRFEVPRRRLVGPRGQADLGPTVWLLALALAERPGEVLPQRDLARLVWGQALLSDDEQRVRTKAHLLRAALRRAGSDQALSTVPSGYRLDLAERREGAG